MSNVPAGWYQDPSGDASKVRYWDGTQWTEQVQDRPIQENPSQPAYVAAPVQPMQVNQPTYPVAPTQPYQQWPQQPMQSGYQQPAPGYAVPQQPEKKNGKAIASLIVGIVGIPLNILLALLGHVCGIVAIVLAVSARKTASKGIATGALVVAIICEALAIINSILGVMLYYGLF